MRTNILPLLRIFLVLYTATLHVPDYFFMLEWSAEQPLEYYVPGTLLKILPIPFPFPQQGVPYFQTALYVAALFSIVGIATRLSLFCYALGYLYVSGVASAWGWHDHGPSMVAQIFLLLPWLPGITDCSIDTYLRSRSTDENTSWRLPALHRKGSYIILLLVVAFYCTSGISKIRYGGLQWMNGKTFSFYLSGKSLSSELQQFGTTEAISRSQQWKDGVGLTHYLYGSRSSSLGRSVSESKLLSMLSAITAVLFEILAPLALFHPGLRSCYFLIAFMFHFSVYFMMGIDFFTWSVIDLCFIEWSYLMRLSFIKHNHALNETIEPAN